MVGTVRPSPLGRIVPLPPMAAKADGMSLAAPACQPRMDADGGKNIRIGGCHDRGHCTAGRETRHIDSCRVGREFLNDLHGDASDE
jgi:hypothetical protein